MQVTKIPRPDYGLFNPKYEGRKRYYWFYLLIGLVLFFLYSIYVAGSIARILQNEFLVIFFNLVVLSIESLITYYALILIWHLAKGFAPVNSPLDPIISKDELSSGNVPFISILMACYKEPFSVVQQSLMSAFDINYPEGKYEVAIIEDGRENSEIENFCKSNDIRYFTRNKRKDFKAGAINFCLPKLNGEYVLFLDADHVVERNIVANCLLAWRQETIAVQTRIDFVNMVTYLTTVAAFLQIQFFSLFQRGRRSSGSAIFAGGAALFDRNLLLKEGGMRPLTIADDTDTSFYLRARGYRIEYIDSVGAWALVPWDPLHLIRQVWRWMTGITRSFRARWLDILKGQSSFYVKVDHFSTAFFPTLAVFGWFIGIVVVIMVRLSIPMIRIITIENFPIGIIPGIIAISSIYTGTMALILDDPHILYRRKPMFTKIITLFGFYLLIIAAQPLLIGAIFKGLFGIPVIFNRTPKEKQSKDEGLLKIKRMYFVYAFIIFVFGVIFFIHGISLPFFDPRLASLSLNTYASVIPLIISFLWYWKLESYLMGVSDISALEFLGNLVSR